MISIDIQTEDDIVRARQAVRDFAAELGFSTMNKTRIATAVSELARNVHVHAGGGRMELDLAINGSRSGIRCTFVDEGPGIPDIEQALADGFSTAGSLGQGMPGSKRLTDEMRVESEPGKGTRVEVIKWQ